MERRSCRWVAFLCYAWASFCLLQRQWTRTYEANPPISNFIHIPVQWLCSSLILQNLRLLLGAVFGKNEASELLGHVWQFMHLIGLPLSLSALFAIFGYLARVSWLRHIGGASGRSSTS